MDLVSDYAQLTQSIVHFTGLSRPMLHIHAGMAIYLGVQVIFATRGETALGVYAVVAIELINEVMNRLYYESWRWSDTLADIALTLFWPVACYGIARIRRQRRRGRYTRATD